MNITVRDAEADDYPHLAQLTGYPVKRWWEWDRKHLVAVAMLDGKIIGVIVVGLDEPALTFEIRHVEVMRYYRRMRVGRHLWTFVVNKVPPAEFAADVDETFVEGCCYLRALGFRCVGRNGDGSLRFERR